MRTAVFGILLVSACSAAMPRSSARTATIELPAAERACRAHVTVDACLADREHLCFFGADLWGPVITGTPCPPPEPVCQSHLAPGPGITLDPDDLAACRAHETPAECVADVAHRCMWPPAILAPCTPDGWCPPPPTCQTAPPDCGPLPATIDVSGPASCGCLEPPDGVCLFAPPDAPGAAPVPAGCAPRPVCDAADRCACLEGLGTCAAGEVANACVCTGAATPS